MKNKIFIIIIAVIFLAGILGSIYVMTRPHGSTVDIIQDGKILYSFDLSSAADRTIDIEYNGRINRVRLENGQIYVEEADCPDKICVKTGPLRSDGLPIVCLPNHLIIKFADKDNDGSTDADVG